MFCVNCGKEMKENVKFCPECGTPVNKAAESMDGREEKGASSKSGICGIGDFEQLRQMTEKAGKTKKIVEIIATLLMLAYAFLMVRGLISMLKSALEGRTDIMTFVFSIFAVILFTCGLLHVGLEIVLPVLQGRKAVRAESYLKHILVNEKRALMHALGQMKCAMVKSVYMDEHGEVCVAGRKSGHTFTVQNGVPVMTSKRDNYKAVLERETIAACLLKFLVPEAPINAYENQKSNARLSRMKILLAAVATVCGIILVVTVFFYGTGSSYINMVKNGYPELYPNITYGKAFDAFFGDCKWNYFESEDGKDVVEFQGNCMYGDDEVTVTIQFLVYEDENTFEIYTAGIDGKEQPALVYSLLLLKIFESYGGNDKKGILQLEDLENDEFASDEFASNEFASDEGESGIYIDDRIDEELQSANEEDDYGKEMVEETDDFDDWMAGLDDTVFFESIYQMSGRWSDGNIEISIGIYTDAEKYSAYDEVGTCFYGEIMGTLYFLGNDNMGHYLMGELAQGDVFILQYWGGEEINIIDASEGLTSGIGATLYCEEHYES